MEVLRGKWGQEAIFRVKKGFFMKNMKKNDVICRHRQGREARVSIANPVYVEQQTFYVSPVLGFQGLARLR